MEEWKRGIFEPSNAQHDVPFATYLDEVEHKAHARFKQIQSTYRDAWVETACAIHKAGYPNSKLERASAEGWGNRGIPSLLVA